MADSLVKILLIGDSNVGKTCLLLRYVDNSFQLDLMTSLGVDFKTKDLAIESDRVKLQIWDTAGQEKFDAITGAFYRGIHGIVLVFDVALRGSFDHTRKWMNSIRDGISDGSPVDLVLVGNKQDLERVVSVEEGEALAKEFGIPYFETSAKDGTNVEAVFGTLARTIVNRRKEKAEQQQAAGNVDLAGDPAQETGECSC
jgi:small GTP-binding protein